MNRYTVPLIALLAMSAQAAVKPNPFRMFGNTK